MRRGARLELFPAVHQIAHFPHERLMAVDHRLCRLAVLVEPRRRHRLLDFADSVLALGDLRFEVLDLRSPRLFSFLRFARFRVRTFLFGVIALRG